MANENSLFSIVSHTSHNTQNRALQKEASITLDVVTLTDTGWLADWLAGWLTDWLTDWLTGWLADQGITEWITLSLPSTPTACALTTYREAPKMYNKPAQWTLGIIYRVNQDLCDKLCGAIDLTVRIIFCQATHVLGRVVYEPSNIEEKTGRLGVVYPCLKRIVQVHVHSQHASNLFYVYVYNVKLRCHHIVPSSTNMPRTKRSRFSKELMKSSKHCVVWMISARKPLLVHTESFSSVSFSLLVTHYNVRKLRQIKDVHSRWMIASSCYCNWLPT
jgi:hypothetical protein